MALGDAAAHRNRAEAIRILQILKRFWIPLVLAALAGVGGFTVWRIHDIFGSPHQPSYAEAAGGDSKTSNSKELTYEVFGPPGTLADISYFDANSEPQWLTQVPLPWSLTFKASSSAVVGNLAAQGDSNTIGCRLVIDGEVKDERISNEVNAYTFCLLKAA